ncbi:hypothetical protein, partial [Frankia sp. CpI1-P]
DLKMLADLSMPIKSLQATL